MNSFFKKILNNKGMSLPEILIAVGIVAVGGMAILKTGEFFQKGQNISKVSANVSLLADDLLKNTQKILSSTENEKGEKVSGLCPMVSTDANSPGVGSIYIKLNKGEKVFNDKNWKYYLTSWIKQKHKDCKIKKGWGRCLAVDSEKFAVNLSEGKLENLNLKAQVEVVPVNMNPYKNNTKGLFSPLSISSSTSFDAKDVGFEITATVFFNDGDARRTKVLQDFLWAPSVGLCQYRLKSKQTVKLSLSGAGASDPKGLTVYNRSGFSGNKKDPVEVNWRKTQAQAGIVTSNGSFITTDKTKNIYGSCNETRYFCPQESSDKRVYGPIDMLANLKYNSANVLGNSSSIKTNLSFKLAKGTGLNLFNNANIRFNLDGRNLTDGKNVTLSRTHTLSLRVKDSSVSSGATNICRKVCQDDQNYNTKGATYEERYTPYLGFNFSAFKQNFVYNTGQNMGCTACYMKNCDQFGLGTFGSMTQMPPQPLDSNLPECSLKESNMSVRSPFSYFGKRKTDTPWNSGSPKCLSAKFDTVKNELIFKPEQCDKKLPVLCYNFGEYFLARDVFDGKEKLSFREYFDAPRRCFETGREVSNAAQLHEFMGVSKLPVPINNDGNYDFVNLANQGSFLAPQFERDNLQLKGWFDRTGISPNRYFWVAMVRDGKNNIIARPPFGVNLKSSDKLALYFNGKGGLTYKQYTFPLNISKDSSNSAFLLTHHLKFKGLYPAKKKKPMKEREFSFLCRKKGINGQFFISKKRSDEFKDGLEACEKEQGLFLPPTTPIGWVDAMAKVNNFSSIHSFPNPSQDSAGKVPFVWVAMSANGNEKYYPFNWTLPSEFDYDDIGNTSDYSPRTEDGDIRIVNGKGYFINPRAVLESKKLEDDDIDEVEAKKGASFNFYSNKDGDENIELNKTAGDLKKSLNSWVSKFNSDASGASMTLKKIKDDEYKVYLEGKAVGPGKKIEINYSGNPKVYGFNKGQSAKSPDPDQLCKLPSGNVQLIGKKKTCDGHIIKASEVLDSKAGNIGFMILGYPEGLEIDLP